MTYPVPFENTYWVIPGYFLAGPFPGDDYSWQLSHAKLKRLAESGIRCLINLMEREETDLFGNFFEPYIEKFKEYVGVGVDVRWTRIPIRDMDIPTRQDMVKILDEIDLAI